MLRPLPFPDLNDPGFSTRGADMRAARAADWCAQMPYGLGMSLFVEHPDQWQALPNDESLIPAAVEEFISGQMIVKGTVLHLLVQASARDPEICANPQFDITAGRRTHFGFGGGAHHCIGHFVARTDIAAALAELSKTFKTITYDGTPEWLPDSGNTGALRLPVRYEVLK